MVIEFIFLKGGQFPKVYRRKANMKLVFNSEISFEEQAES